MISWLALMSFDLKRLALIFLTFLILFSVRTSAKIIDQVLAVVDNKLITRSDLRSQTLFLLEFPLLDEKGKDPHLQFAIDQILFLEDAEKFGTDKPTDKEINEKYNEIQAQTGSEEKLDHLLADEGLTKNDLREMINRYLLSKRFVDQRINFFIFVPDNEIDSYYNEHLDEWKGASLDDVRSTISTTLFEQKRKAKLEDFLVKRRGKASILINPPYPSD